MLRLSPNAEEYQGGFRPSLTPPPDSASTSTVDAGSLIGHAIDPLDGPTLVHRGLSLRGEVSRSLNLAAEGYLPPTVGLTIARAHGISDNRPVVNAINFAASHEIGVLPAPLADQYLQATAVPAAARGEIPVTPVLPPGLLDYYRGVGFPNRGEGLRLLEPDQQVIEVNPNLNDTECLGYPHTDALSALHADEVARTQVAKLESAVLVGTFPTSHFAQGAPGHLELPQRYSPGPANDKSVFRDAMTRRGVTVSPGSHLETASDIPAALSILSSASRVWMKAMGSGGDLVYPIPGPLSETNLRAGISHLRSEAKKAFSLNAYPITFEEYWPQHRLAPVGTKVVAEQHVGDLGAVLVNASVSFVIDRAGKYNVIQMFRQIVDPTTGEFRGGVAINLDTENSQIVKDIFSGNRGGFMDRFGADLQRIAEHVYQDLEFCGVCGCDFWAVEQNNGDIIPVWCELNGRPTMNYIPWVIASKRSPGASGNVNIWAPHALNSLADVERAVGPELLYGDAETGFAFPIAMRCIQFRNAEGSIETALGSNACKLVLGGRDMAHIEQILDHLQNVRGLSYDSNRYPKFSAS